MTRRRIRGSSRRCRAADIDLSRRSPCHQSILRNDRYRPRLRRSDSRRLLECCAARRSPAGTVSAILIAAAVLMSEPRAWFRSPAVAQIVARPVHPEAQEAYLNGMRATGKQTYEGFCSAVAYFEQAIAKPDYAAAYAALSLTQRQFLFAGPLSPPEVIPKAEAAARQALALDDTLPQAHQALAGVLYQYYWNWDEANRQLRRAAEGSRRTSVTPSRGPGAPTMPGVSWRRSRPFVSNSTCHRSVLR